MGAVDAGASPAANQAQQASTPMNGAGASVIAHDASSANNVGPSQQGQQMHEQQLQQSSAAQLQAQGHDVQQVKQIASLQHPTQPQYPAQTQQNPPMQQQYPGQHLQPQYQGQGQPGGYPPPQALYGQPHQYNSGQPVVGHPVPFSGIPMKQEVQQQSGMVLLHYEIVNPQPGCCEIDTLSTGGWLWVVVLAFICWPLMFVPCILPECHDRYQRPVYTTTGVMIPQAHPVGHPPPPQQQQQQ